MMVPLFMQLLCLCLVPHRVLYSSAALPTVLLDLLATVQTIGSRLTEEDGMVTMQNAIQWLAGALPLAIARLLLAICQCILLARSLLAHVALQRLPLRLAFVEAADKVEQRACRQGEPRPHVAGCSIR